MNTWQRPAEQERPEPKKQQKSAAGTKQNTAAAKKQTASYKAQPSSVAAEPKPEYRPKPQYKPKAPPQEPEYSEPPREPEYRREPPRDRYYEPPYEPEYRREYEPEYRREYERDRYYESEYRREAPRERYYEPPREPEYRRDYERDRYYEPEYRREPPHDRYYETERDYYRQPRYDPRYEDREWDTRRSRGEYDDRMPEELVYDDWMPVGTKSKIRKMQELQIREPYDDDFEWEVGGRRRKSAAGGKKSRRGRVIITIVCVLVILVDMYFRFLYTDIPFIRDLRDAYIETAMSTMSHQWMAEWFFPQDIIDEVMNRVEKAQQDQQGIESDWDTKLEQDKKTAAEEDSQKAEQEFFELFWEIDKNTFMDYVAEHREVLENGWRNIYINEAGLDDSGTSIWTKMDEQVLAIDVPNKIILIRVQGSGYQGVLAVAKDPSKLSLSAAENVGAVGEQLDSIMRRTDAILGMTGSGFIDEGGNGNGGSIVGFARCEGQDFGTQVGYPYKRTELRDNNLLYIVDSSNAVDSRTTDAVEFAPALVVNGMGLIDELSGYTSINPRACIGQTEKGEILMLVIEGRLPSRSFGTGLPECTEILMQHNAYQAMNLDGGTSAIMWYDGEYVTKCSNTNITCRTLPNAWIYARAGAAEEETGITDVTNVTDVPTADVPNVITVTDITG